MELVPVLRERLLTYLKADQQAQKYVDAEVFDSFDELLDWELEQAGRFLVLCEQYKADRWGEKFSESHGATPVSSYKKVLRHARGIEEKRAVSICWWLDEHGGLVACAYCGIPLNINEVTYDHIHPQSEGGIDEIVNLVPCCTECNVRKSDRTAAEFLVEVGIDSQEVDGIVHEWCSDSRRLVPAYIAARMSSDQIERLGLRCVESE